MIYYQDNCYWNWENSKATYKDVDDLARFINEFIKACVDQLPLMKLNWWLGYIQGTIISWGLTTVEKERDWTRPLFKHLDFG